MSGMDERNTEDEELAELDTLELIDEEAEIAGTTVDVVVEDELGAIDRANAQRDAERYDALMRDLDGESEPRRSRRRRREDWGQRDAFVPATLSSEERAERQSQERARTVRLTEERRLARKAYKIKKLKRNFALIFTFLIMAIPAIVGAYLWYEPVPTIRHDSYVVAHGEFQEVKIFLDSNDGVKPIAKLLPASQSSLLDTTIGPNDTVEIWIQIILADNSFVEPRNLFISGGMYRTLVITSTVNITFNIADEVEILANWINWWPLALLMPLSFILEVVALRFADERLYVSPDYW